LSATEISYALSAKNHRDLVDTAVGTPRILIVLALHADPSDWLKTSADAFIMKRCAWWKSLRGQPPTLNNATKTIRIPIDQRFDVTALEGMMKRVRAGDVP
jgi:hypothetical protein